eukprot:Hpha_TRINITY_DN22697_c0_g1::TRINITY_DN22697_c0_g1_i1::g.192633::m.192633
MHACSVLWSHPHDPPPRLLATPRKPLPPRRPPHPKTCPRLEPLAGDVEGEWVFDIELNTSTGVEYGRVDMKRKTAVWSDRGYVITEVSPGLRVDGMLFQGPHKEVALGTSFRLYNGGEYGVSVHLLVEEGQGRDGGWTNEVLREGGWEEHKEAAFKWG